MSPKRFMIKLKIFLKGGKPFFWIFLLGEKGLLFMNTFRLKIVILKFSFIMCVNIVLIFHLYPFNYNLIFNDFRIASEDVLVEGKSDTLNSITTWIDQGFGLMDTAVNVTDETQLSAHTTAVNVIIIANSF